MDGDSLAECPVCEQKFAQDNLVVHVNTCLFLRESEQAGKSPGTSGGGGKRKVFSIFGQQKRPKQEVNNNQSKQVEAQIVINSDDEEDGQLAGKKRDQMKVLKEEQKNPAKSSTLKEFRKDEDQRTAVLASTNIPLAEKMRPDTLDKYIGQTHVMNKNAVLRQVIDKHEIPSMILWGPPGCGKTTLAHVIANRCKGTQNVRFVKLSATTVGVNDVKEVVKVAKNEQKFKRKTILFMDEIHRFNKLQQDIFLPHVESGTITLIGATTENPSFSLNSALLSRCRVVVLEKIVPEAMQQILERAVQEEGGEVKDMSDPQSSSSLNPSSGFVISLEAIKWLSEICDGDARIALNSLQLALQATSTKASSGEDLPLLQIITLEDIQESIRKSHILYDRKGDQHYDMISALHKSIRASDDNAALYWCTRMIVGGEDPRFICRRLVRAASEDIGLADPNAVQVALSALQAVQLVGMPESDCIITQCAVYLARAPKSRETYQATNECRRDIENCKGLLPPVPLHLRNAPTKLMKELGCGKGYNLSHKDVSGLTYMPEGMENKTYFQESP